MDIQLSLPTDHHFAWSAQAIAEEHALNHWILLCCLENIPAATQQELSQLRPKRFVKPPGEASADTNKTHRIKLRVPDDHAAAWDTAAAEMQLSRSAWIRWCCTANLPAAVRKALSEPKGKGRPKTAGE